jgi:predicted nucleotidyltransferase
VHRIIKKLAQLNVVSLQEQGKGQFIKINFANELSRSLLSAANYLKREEIFNKYHSLRIIAKEFNFNAPLLIFGSYAKQKIRKGSDIDLCVFGLKQKEEKIFKRKLKEIELIHNVEINCLFFRRKEFEDMLKTKSHNVGKEILLNHFVLSNADLWYNFIAEVYDEIRL